MADAVDAGTIDIAYSMGKFPFVQRVNAGIAMQTVSVAAQYASSPCIVRTGSGISAANATELQGKNVAVPLRLQPRWLTALLIWLVYLVARQPTRRL